MNTVFDSTTRPVVSQIGISATAQGAMRSMRYGNASAPLREERFDLDGRLSAILSGTGSDRAGPGNLNSTIGGFPAP